MRFFGKGKCKVIANCANFWQGKYKFIANFSATMVTSLPSLSLSVCISLSNRKYLTHNIGSASALPLISDGAIAVEGYILFRRDRKTGQQGGGVCLYVHHQFPVRVLNNLDHPDLEMLWLEIAIGKQKVTVGCVDRPPSTPTEFWSALENVTDEIMGRSIILLGDLNVNLIDRSDTQYKHFSSLCLSLQLQEIVQMPTRVTEKSAKCIHLILTNTSY